MSTDARAPLASAWLHGALLTGATLAAWLALGFREAPIYWDPAYFTYLGQAILRGEPIYQRTFIFYPPLGPLVSAASMAVGSWFDLPSYLAPRYLAVAVGLASVLLVYAVARRATDSAWAGLVSGLVLAGFQPLAASSLSTLEPKHLVVLFTLVAGAASQHRRWMLVGCAASLAASCYPPAALVPLTFALVTGANAGPGRRGLGAYAAGLALGALPSAIYLAASGGFADVWVRLEALSSARLSGAIRPAHWLEVAAGDYASDVPFLVAAAVGWSWHTFQGLRRGPRRLLRAWADPGCAGMPLLAACWAGFFTLSFEGYPDLYPLLPVAAFWAGWLADRVLTLTRVSLPRRPAAAAMGPAPGVALVLLTALGAFRDVPSHRHLFSLDQQRAVVRRIVGPADSTVMAFSAEEVYVLSERPSPNPFLRTLWMHVPLLPLVGLDGCEGVLAKILDEQPRAVAIRVLTRGCERRLAGWLVKNGYRGERTSLDIMVFYPPEREDPADQGH